MSEYHPTRIEDELPDLVFYSVNNGVQPPGLKIESDGTRMSRAYGNTGKGRYLGEYLGARLAKLRSIIDRDLFHRAPGRIPSGDVLEFG